MERKQIVDLVLAALKSVNEIHLSDRKIPLEESTPLLGEGSQLDSLALVQLVVEVEQRLSMDAGVQASLTSEKAMSQRTSPFLTVATLAEYILQEAKPVDA